MRALILVAAALAACTAQPAKQEETPAAETTASAAAPGTQDSNLAQMPSWENARAAGVDFRAVGQEPGWMVDIYTANRIVALLDYGESLIEFPRPEPSYPVEGSTSYQTQADGHTLSITIRRSPCQDAMSGEAYPTTVDVVVDGRALNGCGRSV
ncbi:MAG: COG3650 family protein [Hyphomonadaceae bacterium]